MIETVIVDSPNGFRTYSGWTVSRTHEHLMLAVIGDPHGEPTVVAIPLDHIVTIAGAAA